MRSREEWIADTMVELADMLVPTFDPESYLLCVADRYTQVIPSSSVLAAVGGHHDRSIVVTTDERLGRTPLGELLGEEGPGADCRTTGEPIVNVLLEESAARWTRLAPAAHSAGFRSVHAFPFNRHEEVLGAVTILTAETTPLPASDVRIAGALADISTISLLNHRALAKSAKTSEQLQGALSSRVIIEQAKGLVSARLEIGPGEAFVLVRRFARSHNLRIADVSEALVSRRLTAAALRASIPDRAGSPR